MCVGGRGGGLEGLYVSSCNNLYYRFKKTTTPICLFNIISLNTFDVAQMFFLHVVFKLMNL